MECIYDRYTLIAPVAYPLQQPPRQAQHASHGGPSGAIFGDDGLQAHSDRGMWPARHRRVKGGRAAGAATRGERNGGSGTARTRGRDGTGAPGTRGGNLNPDGASGTGLHLHADAAHGRGLRFGLRRRHGG